MPLRLNSPESQDRWRRAGPALRARCRLARSNIVCGQGVLGERPELGGGQPIAPVSAVHVPNTYASSHVFISYGSEKRRHRETLVEAVERHGLMCWIALRDVRQGRCTPTLGPSDTKPKPAMPESESFIG